MQTSVMPWSDLENSLVALPPLYGPSVTGKMEYMQITRFFFCGRKRVLVFLKGFTRNK